MIRRPPRSPLFPSTPLSRSSQIVNALAMPFQLGGDTASIGVSVGIATAITDERKELVSRADFALYDAKESGRNTFRVLDRKSTRLNSSHLVISYAVFCLKIK